MREGWKRIRLGDVFDVSTTKLGAHSEEPAVFAISKYDGVVLSGDYHERRVASAKLDGYKVLDTDAWAYSTIHIDEGSIARNNHGFAGVVSPMYTILNWVSEDCVPAYFEHLLRTPAMLSIYKDMAQGSINRRCSLPWKSFSAIEVDVPPLEEQQRIVDLIGSLDDAIEAADAAAEASKEAAHELRNDLLAPRDGWAQVTMGDLADFDNGYPFKPADLGSEGAPVIRIRQLLDPSVEPDRSNAAVKDSQRINDGDVIFSWSATLAVRSWNRGPGLLNQHLFKVTPKAGVSKDFVKECLELCIPNLHTHGTTMVHVTKKELLGHGTVLPPLDEQNEIAETLKAASESVGAAESVAASLRAARSEILTVLLSGEHEIPESYDVDTAVQLESAA